MEIQRADRWTSRRIGPYSVHEREHCGNFSSIYRCADVHVKRDLAIKVARVGYGDLRAANRRLWIEAEVRGSVDHPHLLPLYRAVRSSRGSYLVGPWLTGGPLVARPGILPPSTIVALTAGIGAALDSVHDAGWVHGDLNARNVLFAEDGRPVLIDFASAWRAGVRRLPPEEAELLELSPHAVAPEVWRGGYPDGRSDLYSLGILLYRCLTGSYPYSGQSWQEYAKQHCTMSLPLPSNHAASVGPNVEAFLLRALAKDAEGRFETGSELTTALSKSFIEDGAWSPTLRVDDLAGTPKDHPSPVASGARQAAVDAGTLHQAGQNLESFADSLDEGEQRALRALLEEIERMDAQAISVVADMTSSVFGVPAALLALERIGAAAELAEVPATAAEVADRCGASVSATDRLLGVLAAAGLVNQRKGRFHLQSELALIYNKARQLGVTATPVADAAQLWRYAPQWACSGDPYLEMDRPDGARYQMVAGTLYALFVEPAQKLAAELFSTGKFPPGAAVLDIGAGSGVWSLALAALDPCATITAVDRPAVLERTRFHAASVGVADRLTSVGGDWRDVHLPEATFDVALLANICHLEAPGEVEALLKWVQSLLRPGGCLALVDTIPADTTTAPLPVQLESLRLALRSSSGGLHDLESYLRWLDRAGLAYDRLIRLANDSSAFVALLANRPAGRSS